MAEAKKKYFLAVMIALSLIFLNNEIRFKGAFAQSMLPGGVTIKEGYQAGPGLPVGKIQSVWGDVVILHAEMEDAYLAKIGLPMFSGDTIVTPENGSFGFQLNDGSIVKLAAQSKLTINLSAHYSNRKSSITLLSLIAGKAYFQIAKLDEYEPREFKVETDVLVVGGRQAHFAVLISEEITEIFTLRDTHLEIMSSEDPEQKIFLSEFQRAVIEGGDLPSMVEMIPEEQANALLDEFRKFSVGNLSEIALNNFGDQETAADKDIQEEKTDKDTFLLQFP